MFYVSRYSFIRVLPEPEDDENDMLDMHGLRPNVSSIRLATYTTILLFFVTGS